MSLMLLLQNTGDREIKVRGTWRGYSVADPELNKPINEPHYFDLETGEELNYSLSLILNVKFM